jgi:hypothetical protein
VILFDPLLLTVQPREDPVEDGRLALLLAEGDVGPLDLLLQLSGERCLFLHDEDPLLLALADEGGGVLLG